MKPRILTALVILLSACILPAHLLADDHPAVDAGSALASLKAGNVRFVSSSESAPMPTRRARLESVDGQHPVAAVVTCSDSRTAPEIILNQNLNRLFVVRTAGNVVDDVALGSLEYAVNHLGVRLIVVMGHENCGAVAAAVQGGKAPSHLNSVVKRIAPAVKEAASMSSIKGDLLHHAIECNARRMAKMIAETGHFEENAKEVKVVPAVYDFKTGKIDWLGN